jgi:hypothetical protein
MSSYFGTIVASGLLAYDDATGKATLIGGLNISDVQLVPLPGGGGVDCWEVTIDPGAVRVDAINQAYAPQATIGWVGTAETIIAAFQIIPSPGPPLKVRVYLIDVAAGALTSVSVAFSPPRQGGCSFLLSQAGEKFIP